MNFISIAKLNEDIINNLYKVPRDVDIIVGIPRSGMMVASLISLYMNKTLADIDSFCSKKMFSVGITKNTDKCIKKFENVKKVVVVDDSIDTGRSLNLAKQKLKIFNESGIEIIYLAAYVTSFSKTMCDIYFDLIEQPRKFEWNFMQKKDLINACVDIDGVLCIDPTAVENDDGKKYLEFLKNANPKYIPSCKIGYIVTSRLEKYRKETELWLRKNNIEYKKLIMLNINTAEERQKLGNHGKFKAEVFKSIKDATWFIESEASQAIEIQKISKKSVVCVDNNIVQIKSVSKLKKIKNESKLFVKKVIGEKNYNKIKKNIKKVKK